MDGLHSCVLHCPFRMNVQLRIFTNIESYRMNISACCVSSTSADGKVARIMATITSKGRNWPATWSCTRGYLHSHVQAALWTSQLQRAETTTNALTMETSLINVVKKTAQDGSRRAQRSGTTREHTLASGLTDATCATSASETHRTCQSTKGYIFVIDSSVKIAGR